MGVDDASGEKSRDALSVDADQEAPVDLRNNGVTGLRDKHSSVGSER